MVQWALQFFPSTRRVTKAFVGLGPILLGAQGPHPDGDCLDNSTAVRNCYPYVWQTESNSQYLTALRHKSHVAQVPTTYIYSDV
jgi:triacylglycerol lipase